MTIHYPNGQGPSVHQSRPQPAVNLPTGECLEAEINASNAYYLATNQR